MNVAECVWATVVLGSAAITGCGDEGGDDGDDQEFITTVELTFTPMGGGTAVVATWDDPENDGSPVIDPINLPDATTYTLAVRFENRLETPPEDITIEVMDEGDQHQVFLTGDAVNGPAADNPLAPLAHTYADMDARGLPIGLSNTIVTSGGTGTLTVTLRHLPPVGGSDVKVADLAAMVRAGGLGSIGGDTDVSVDFMVTAGAPTPP